MLRELTLLACVKGDSRALAGMARTLVPSHQDKSPQRPRQQSFRSLFPSRITGGAQGRCARGHVTAGHSSSRPLSARRGYGRQCEPAHRGSSLRAALVSFGQASHRPCSWAHRSLGLLQNRLSRLLQNRSYTLADGLGVGCPDAHSRLERARELAAPPWALPAPAYRVLKIRSDYLVRGVLRA